MGVKDLWLVLHKAQKRVTLKELSGKKLAVDLSGWICQAFGTQGTCHIATADIARLSPGVIVNSLRVKFPPPEVAA